MQLDIRAFKKFHGIPESVRDRAAVNTAIRKNMPGGEEVLSVIERLIQMQHGRAKPDPALQDMLDKLAAARDRMAAALIAGFTASVAQPEPKKIGPPLAEKRIDWSVADWTKTNAELAREFGVTRQAVAKQRKKELEKSGQK